MGFNDTTDDIPLEEQTERLYTTRRIFLSGAAITAAAAFFWPMEVYAAPRDSSRKGKKPSPKEVPKPAAQETMNQAVRRKIESLYQDASLERGVERISVVVRDLRTGTMLVDYNGDAALQMASLSKPLIAAAKITYLEQQGLPLDAQTFRRMKLMMTSDSKYLTKGDVKEFNVQGRRPSYFSNAIHNRFMAELGGPAGVQRLLTNAYPGMFRQLALVQPIPLPEGDEYKNKASAKDYDRFLRALYRNELTRSHDLRTIMGLKGPFGNKLVNFVPNIPNDTDLLHKTGTTQESCSDIGTIKPNKSEKKNPYNIIILIDRDTRAQQRAWCRVRGYGVIRPLSGLVYSMMPQR